MREIAITHFGGVDEYQNLLLLKEEIEQRYETFVDHIDDIIAEMQNIETIYQRIFNNLGPPLYAFPGRRPPRGWEPESALRLRNREEAWQTFEGYPPGTAPSPEWFRLQNQKVFFIRQLFQMQDQYNRVNNRLAELATIRDIARLNIVSRQTRRK